MEAGKLLLFFHNMYLGPVQEREPWYPAKM